jgi:hypothetical protein
MTTNEVHLFETAGLGKAPFRFVGVEEKRGPIRCVDQATGLEMTIGAPGQPMGTCQYCGQGIAICCYVRSSDGKTFYVGSDCIAKVGDTGLRKKVDSWVSQRNKSKEQGRINAIQAKLVDKDFQAKLAELPSPTGRGSMLDWATWMMRNAGHSGKLRVTRKLESF